MKVPLLRLLQYFLQAPPTPSSLKSTVHLPITSLPLPGCLFPLHQDQVMWWRCCLSQRGSWPRYWGSQDHHPPPHLLTAFHIPSSKSAHLCIQLFLISSIEWSWRGVFLPHRKPQQLGWSLRALLMMTHHRHPTNNGRNPCINTYTHTWIFAEILGACNNTIMSWKYNSACPLSSPSILWSYTTDYCCISFQSWSIHTYNWNFHPTLLNEIILIFASFIHRHLFSSEWIVTITISTVCNIVQKVRKNVCYKLQYTTKW